MKPSITPKRIAFLCSGKGSIFKKVCSAVQAKLLVSQIVLCIIDRICDSQDVSKSYGIPVSLVFRKDYNSSLEFSNEILKLLNEAQVDYVCLTFDCILEGPLLNKFKNRIINVHPALLPAFKGLNAVRKTFESGVLIGGVTIHFIDNQLDHGPVISQCVIPLNPGETMAQYDSIVFRASYIQLIQVISWIESNRVELQDSRIVRIKNAKYNALPFNPALEIPELLKL